MASMYAVWHGAEEPPSRTPHHHRTAYSQRCRATRPYARQRDYFDTICIELSERSADDVIAAAAKREINLRSAGDSRIIVALDETVTDDDVQTLLTIFAGDAPAPETGALAEEIDDRFDERFARILPSASMMLTHHSETRCCATCAACGEGLSLHSMIPLSSCTMKLNATAEMFLTGVAELRARHRPRAASIRREYQELFRNLKRRSPESTVPLPGVLHCPLVRRESTRVCSRLPRIMHRAATYTATSADSRRLLGRIRPAR